MLSNRRLGKLHIKQELSAYAFVGPFLVLFLGFEVFPFIKAIYLSLFNYGLGEKKWIGLQNYNNLLHNAVFLKSLLNTLEFVLETVPIAIIFSLFIAAIIIHRTPRVAAFFRAAFYMPIVASQVILSITWAWIYDPENGAANYVLSLFHIKPVMWLANSHVALSALALVAVTWSVGQPIILYLAALGSIPQAYYEAAKIDGASAWRQFWNVTLPLLTPTTLYVIVINTIGAFQTFVVVQMLTGGGPNYATSTIMYLLYNTAFNYGQLGLASAMGVILAILISIVSILQFRLFRTGFEY